MRDTLYPTRAKRNRTLESIARLAARCVVARRTLKVITYNFDNLLEQHLDAQGLAGRYVVVDSSESFSKGARSSALVTVYHPHGYMPQGGDVERLLRSMLIFSEQQYHRSYFEHDHWSNALQRAAFSTTACLFAGCSFNDQNLRRLLDQSKVEQSPCLAAMFKTSDQFKSPARNMNRDLVIQHELSLFRVRPLWVKQYSQIPAILDRLAV